MRKVALILVGIVLLTAVLLNRRTAVVNVPSEPLAVVETEKAQQNIPETEEKPGESEVIAIPTGVDSKAAFETLMRMDPGPARLNAMLQLVRTWAQENPRATAETLLAQTSGSERARGVAQAVSVWAKSDPSTALKWVNETPMDPTLAAQVRTQLYATWAANNPSAAIESAIAGQFTGSELNAIFATWATQDLDSAVQFQDEKLPAELKKQIWPVLLLTAAAQKSEILDTLFDDFFASEPTTPELLAIGKTLSATDPHFASLVADRLPSTEGEILRRKINSLHPDFAQTGAVISDTQEAGIPTAPPVVIPAAGGEPANSIPK